MGVKLLKRIAAACLGLMTFGLMVFVIAGLLPVKELLPGEDQSCYVEMEDGTKLAVWYHLPEEAARGQKVPAIMETTRYVSKSERSFLLRALLNLRIAKEVPDAASKTFLEDGYAVIKVDARGSGASFGHRDMEWSREEVRDMGQVIDWIVQQPWSSGSVGSYGISYSGNTAELAMASGRTALKAAAVLYPDFDVLSQSVMPGGIFNEKIIRAWGEETAKMDRNQTSTVFYKGISPIEGDPHGKLMKKAIEEHRTVDIAKAFESITYRDDTLAAGYTADAISPFQYRSQIEASQIPIYVRVGWMDAGTVNGAIERFLTYRNDQTLEIGPWSHGGRYFSDPYLVNASNRGEMEREQATAVTTFFDEYLKDEKASGSSHSGSLSTAASVKRLKYYTLGEGTWKTSDIWPIDGVKTRMFYFSHNGILEEAKPAGSTGSDLYQVDFTASTGSHNRWATNLGGGRIAYGNRAEEDQKLLTYTSKPLEEDAEITGQPVVTLSLSANVEDCAIFVYLEDVAPDGTVTYITEGELRLLHRALTNEDLGYTAIGPKHSYKKKDGELLTPGKTTEVKIGLYASSVLIRKGHRIRISVAGHDAENFVRIPPDATPTIQIERNGVQASWVELPMKIRN